MDNKTRVAVGVLFCALLLMSCADNLLMNKRIYTNLRGYPNVVIVGKSAVPDDVVSELYSLQENVKLRIQQLGKFRSVKVGSVAESVESTLIVQITISEIRKVDDALAFALGEFAGHSRLEAYVGLIEASSNTVLGQYWVKGYSVGGTVGGGMEEAIMKAADTIAEVIDRHCK